MDEAGLVFPAGHNSFPFVPRGDVPGRPVNRGEPDGKAAEPRQYVPEGQAPHALAFVEPGVLHVPGGQYVQLEALVPVVAYVPPGQVTCEVWPGVATKAPAPAAVQAACCAFGL